MAEIHNQRPGIDPLQERKFWVIIDGLAEIGFSTFSEPEESFGVSKYREGDDPDYPTKQRGMRDYSSIDLERGVFADEDVISSWAETGERKTVDIVRLDHLGNEVKRYKFHNAFPVKYSIGKGDAMGEDSTVVQKLTFEYEWFEVSTST